MRTFSSHHRSGFTLIELIVAMGMVAILSVSLYASLRIAFRAKDSAEKTIEPARTAELAMRAGNRALARSIKAISALTSPACLSAAIRAALVPPVAQHIWVHLKRPNET